MDSSWHKHNWPIYLNNYFNEIYDYLFKWKSKINANKCEEMPLMGNIEQTAQRVRRRANKNKLKYLGINFLANFFNYHIEQMLASYIVLKDIFFNKKTIR